MYLLSNFAMCDNLYFALLLFKVNRISSIEKTGVPKLWSAMLEFKKVTSEAGELSSKREKQLLLWFWSQVGNHITTKFKAHPRVKTLLPDVERMVARGEVTPGRAADFLLEEFLGL